LSGKQEITFGQMLMVAKMSVASCQTPLGPFAGWLKTNRPSYFNRIGRLGEQMMLELRNREDHVKMRLIMEADADRMLEASKDVISMMHEDRARQSLG
jgi:hypothetical protein